MTMTPTPSPTASPGAEPGSLASHFEALLRYCAQANGAQGQSLAAAAHADSRLTQDIDSLGSLRAAAVLIAVTRPKPAEPSRVVLTLRSEKLTSHAGQVSLPGGSCDPEDSSRQETALREAEEEIGLPREAVEVIGQMGAIALPSGFEITPIIGLIDSGLTLTPCPREVADIFHPPLDLLMTPQAYLRSSAHYRGAERTILELGYEGFRIWGATAAILHSLAKQVQAERSRGTVLG